MRNICIRILLVSAFFILTSTYCKDDIVDLKVFMTNNQNETIYVIPCRFSDNHLAIPAEAFLYHKTIIKGYEKGLVYGYNSEFYDKDVALQFLVYKKSTLEKYTEQEIKKYDIYDKRFFLTLEDLEACDFHIYYSDGEDMNK